MKWLKRAAYLLGGLYLAACFLLYFGQERLIFHPRQLPANYAAGAYGGDREVSLTTADGSVLNALHFRKPDAPGVVLYLHGNRGDNQRSHRQTRGILEGKYDLFLLDYRGFGKSAGAISSEEQLFADAQLAYDYLRERYPENRIVVVGYSLGSGMASYLASQNRPQHCLLVAPYASVTAMKNLWLWAVPDFLLKYPLNNLAHVRRANCPVTVLHGETDDFIPYAMSEALYEAAPDRVRLIGLANTGHRGAILHPRFVATVRELTDAPR